MGMAREPRRSLKRPQAAMRKRFRLRKNLDFQKVYKKGHSWTHPLLVLYALRNDLQYSRFGFSVSKRVGGAVVRNRTKRLMREATRLRQVMITDGWDVVIIARQPIREANFHQVDRAVEQLLRRACLLKTAEETTGEDLPVALSEG